MGAKKEPTATEVLTKQFKQFVEAQETNINSNVLTVEGACAYLKLSDRKVRELISENDIPFTKIDGSIRFIRTELDKWLKKLTQKVG